VKQKQIRQKEIVFELNLKFQLRDYSFKFGVKKVWAVAILLLLARVIFWLVKMWSE